MPEVEGSACLPNYVRPTHTDVCDREGCSQASLQFSRRQMLGGAGAAMAIMAMPGRAFACRPEIRIVDIHHHFYPPEYISKRRTEIESVSPAGFSVAPQWTVSQSLDAMDAAGVAKSIISVPGPGVWFGDDEDARIMARKCNEFAADLKQRFPKRFDFFATLPLPDVTGALEEVEYAFDVLGAAGVTLLTSYEGLYLGEAKFSPLLEELNRRSATAFVHPIHCTACANFQEPLPSVFLELPFDTTRTAASLLFSGSLSRFRKLNFIFSHGGGTLPMLTGRMEIWKNANPNFAELYPQGLQSELARHYYDTVSINSPSAISALKAFVPNSQLMFGTDFPFGPIGPQIAAIENFGLSDMENAALLGGNAIHLFGA